MAINVSFNGATIYKPGAYSKVEIDLGGGFPLSPTGLVGIFGESTQGTPGANVPDISTNVFTPDQFPLVQQMYGSGPIVDACNFLFAPGADGAIPGGAQAVYIYKTNSSTRASLALGSNFGTVQSLAWGLNGNLITYQNALVPASPASISSSVPFNISGGYFDVGTPGVPHLDDALASAAQAAASAAYTSLSAHSPYNLIPNVLDGQSLTAGYYDFSAGDVNLASSGPGTLTLTGSATDVFVFKTGSTLTTGAGGMPTITLAGGALASNVYWIVGSAATLNSGVTSAGAVFNGNVIAQTSISVSQTSTVNGSLIALGGAVTLAAAGNINAQYSPLISPAGDFGILGASAVTSTGATVVNGAVGVSPGTSVTGFNPPGTIVMPGGETLVLRINGADPSLDNTFTINSPILTRAEFQAALNLASNWSLGLPVGMTFTIGGATDVAATLTIAQTASPTPGFSQNFELVSGSLLGTGLGKVSIPAGLVGPGAEPQTMITISNLNSSVTESAILGGTVVLEIGRYGAGNVTPQVTINATQLLLINNAHTEYAITLANFSSISQLALYINSSTAGLWSAQAGSTALGQMSPSIMDEVTAVGAAATSSSDFPAQIKDDAYQVAQFFASSANVSLLQNPGQGVVGLPPASPQSYLAGGTLGSTQTADIVNALTKFQKIRLNSVVPLFSRDAAEDIEDGYTDPASNYTILGIHQAVKTHLSLMSTTKNRSERQGYLSMHDTYANCSTEAGNLADARIQLVIQDVLQDNSLGAITWFLPWAGACMLAGARGGSPGGTPMTNKFFNMSGIRQTGQLMSTPEADIVIDFDPDLDYDEAIIAGITFWEHPQTGGYKLVVDNTTYSQDDNWVYNRANVLYASDLIVYDFRSQMENIYVGVKNTVTAAEIASTATSILNTYLAQGLTVSTSDAKPGFKQLVVTINGDIVNISVVLKLVEGIDFILADFKLQRATSTATA